MFSILLEHRLLLKDSIRDIFIEAEVGKQRRKKNIHYGITQGDGIFASRRAIKKKMQSTTVIICVLLCVLRATAFRFVDVSEKAGLDHSDGRKEKYGGAAVADLDGDGYPDLIFGHHDKPFTEIYFNNGNGTFSKSRWRVHRDTHGINPFRFSPHEQAMHFTLSPGGNYGNTPKTPSLFAVSMNRHVINVTAGSGMDRNSARGRGRTVAFMNLRGRSSPLVDALVTSALLEGKRHHQNGFQGKRVGHFRKRFVKGFAHVKNAWATVTDIDNDGQVELLSFHELSMYRVVGPFKLRNISKQVFPAGLPLEGTTAVAELDFDNDGYMDLYVARSSAGNFKWLPRGGEQDYLLRNVNGRYEDVSESAGIPLNLQSRGVTAGDFDNDGYIDLLVTQYRAPDILLRNRGDGTFSSRDAGLMRARNVRGDIATAVDYDRDGSLDLVVSEGDHDDERNGGFYKLFRNVGRKGNYLLVRVKNAKGGGATSLHAVVRVHTNMLGMMRRVGSPGTAVSNSYIELIHFGLGTEEFANAVGVTWSDGSHECRFKLESGVVHEFGE